MFGFALKMLDFAGPRGLQVLAFLGGFLLSIASFFGIFLSLARLEVAVLAIQVGLLRISIETPDF